MQNSANLLATSHCCEFATLFLVISPCNEFTTFVRFLTRLIADNAVPQISAKPYPAPNLAGGAGGFVLSTVRKNSCESEICALLCGVLPLLTTPNNNYFLLSRGFPFFTFLYGFNNWEIGKSVINISHFPVFPFFKVVETVKYRLLFEYKPEPPLPSYSYFALTC